MWCKNRLRVPLTTAASGLTSVENTRSKFTNTFTVAGLFHCLLCTDGVLHLCPGQVWSWNESNWNIKRIQVTNPFINHVMFHAHWIMSACTFMSGKQIWFLVPSPFSALHFHLLESHFGLSPFSFCSASALLLLVWVRPLGSKGSKTVTQSSLVIGHGHANQTGRNLQLIRILPPAIIVPHHWPHRPPLHKINYILGSIPTIGFPVLELLYREEGGESQDKIVLFQLQKQQLSCGKLRKQRQTPIHPYIHPSV